MTDFICFLKSTRYILRTTDLQSELCMCSGCHKYETKYINLKLIQNINYASLAGINLQLSHINLLHISFCNPSHTKWVWLRLYSTVSLTSVEEQLDISCKYLLKHLNEFVFYTDHILKILTSKAQQLFINLGEDTVF